MTRSFAAVQATMHEVPLLIGLEGPPGGGKTYSALRLATGMKRVRSGPIVLIDTESGRASKYAKEFDFLTVPFSPPFRPTDFLAAIREQLKLKPACIIVDSLSDEHEGEGGVLDWHDECVKKFGGNEYAAWGPPKSDRKHLIAGMLQIMTPIIVTFRAREKTVQQAGNNGKKEVVNIGFQPIAPAEIVYALDLVCLLPNKSNGVPQWKSDKAGEAFMTKLPNYLAPHLKLGSPLDEGMGEAFARWALGDVAAPIERPVTMQPISKPTDSMIERPSPAKKDFTPDDWATIWRNRIADPDASAPELSTAWDKPQNKAMRDRVARENADLAREVTDEVIGAIRALETA